MSKVYIIHENGEWVAPLRERLKALHTPFEEWNLVHGTVPIDDVPPEGIFYNRMSASSYTRNHRFSPEYAAVVMSWLEAHNRTIVNDSRALALEINKAAQYQILRAAGIKTPRTVIAVGNDAILEAADTFGEEPLILKPNRGGKETVCSCLRMLGNSSNTLTRQDMSHLSMAFLWSRNTFMHLIDPSRGPSSLVVGSFTLCALIRLMDSSFAPLMSAKCQERHRSRCFAC